MDVFILVNSKQRLVSPVYFTDPAAAARVALAYGDVFVAVVKLSQI